MSTFFLRLVTAACAALLLVCALLRPAVAAQPENNKRSAIFYGTISNSFDLNGKIDAGVRRFKVCVEGINSSFDVTNTQRDAHSHGAFIGDDYSSYTQLPFVNPSTGNLEVPIAARIDRRPTPPDDGKWINYLWLAFASHSYFTNRSGLDAAPIWTTGLTADQEKSMPVFARYEPLPDSPFPSHVAYFTDGFRYSRDTHTKSLLKIAFEHPFEGGITNFVGRTGSVTNIAGVLYPMSFDITRYGVAKGRANTGATLKPLMVSHIAVTKVELSDQIVRPPAFEGQAVAVDYRFAAPSSQIGGIHMPMSDGKWPDRSNTLHQQQLQQRMLRQAAATAPQ